MNRRQSSILLLIIALGVLLFSAPWELFVQPWYAFLALLLGSLGYYFGVLTCHGHAKSRYLWITIISFALLNLLHSLIDGLSIVHGAQHSSLGIVLHELVRQPGLYIILFGLLSPFTLSSRTKWLVSITTITGIWLAGLLLGSRVGQLLTRFESLHTAVELLVFVLIGDITHHIAEEFQKSKTKTCCHDH